MWILCGVEISNGCDKQSVMTVVTVHRIDQNCSYPHQRTKKSSGVGGNADSVKRFGSS